MLSRADLQSLSHARLEDAQLLLANNRHAGAYYIAGYAVELGLKSAITRQFFAGVIPDRSFVNNVYTHDLAKLVALAGLTHALSQAERDTAFAANWSVGTQWSEASRYEMIDVFRARELVEAISDAKYGIMQWLVQHW
jgi:hypothetical protein